MDQFLSRGREDGQQAPEDLLQLLYLIPVGIVKFKADGEIDLINPRASEFLLRVNGDYGLSNLYAALSSPLPDLGSRVKGFVDASGLIGDEVRLSFGSATFSLNIHKIDELCYVAILQDISELSKLNARLQQENQRRKHQAVRIRTIGRQFREALNNISQGVCMFDAEQRVIIASQPFCAIYKLTPDQVRPGTTLRQILEHRHLRGTDFGQDTAKYVLTKPTLENETNRLVDGRLIAIARHPLSNGGWVSTHADITERSQTDERIAFMAHHDQLTGLPNRVLLSEKLEEAATQMRRKGDTFSVLMLDLDKFKNVNDTLGHPIGDDLLKAVADRLKSSLRKGDILARLGGDEFGIIQRGNESQRESAIALALRIEETLSRPFCLDGHTVNIGASIGIAMALDTTSVPHDLLKQADLALYRTKSDRRGCFSFFSPDLLKRAEARRLLEVEMREAMQRNEFELHYQPIIDVETLGVAGVEALVRWRHPSEGLIPPDQFIPLAEETGLIIPLGDWILRQACADAVKWPENVKVAVNLSAVQFRKGNLIEVILCALVESGLNPRRLELEITESVLLDDDEAHLATITQLKNLGVTFALDDFGTGYSSLSYLTRFPFHKIKIDKSFTQGVLNRRDCKAVVASTLALAKGLGTVTTAEGIETEEQLRYMRQAGVDLAQGYLFGRPLPFAQLDLRNANLRKAPREMVA